MSQQEHAPQACARRRWWQVGRPIGRCFNCPICRQQINGGGNGALASHFRAKHPDADWKQHRRNK